METPKTPGNSVKIIPFTDEYKSAFKTLNEQWISTHFEIEETDRKALDHPQSYILDKGGKILVALYNDQPVGVCALVKMNDSNYQFELAKMAVSTEVQGKGIGYLLGQTALAEAKQLGAGKIYLESNTKLMPAINLYYKLGFKEIEERTTPYARCNIQMELDLNANG